MSVTVLLELQSNAENIERLKSTFKEILVDTRDYDGCRGVEIFDNQDDPNNLVLVERWESRQHYEAYLGWRTETGTLDTLVSMTSQPPSIRYYDAVDA